MATWTGATRLSREYAVGSTPHLDPLPAPSGERKAGTHLSRIRDLPFRRSLRRRGFRVLVGEHVRNHMDIGGEFERLRGAIGEGQLNKVSGPAFGGFL